MVTNNEMSNGIRLYFGLGMDYESDGTNIGPVIYIKKQIILARINILCQSNRS